MEACVPSEIGSPDGRVRFGKQMFPAPVSLRGKFGRVMLKLVTFTPKPRLTHTRAAPSRRVKLRDPPSSGHGVRVVLASSLMPEPIVPLAYFGIQGLERRTRIDSLVVGGVKRVRPPFGVPELGVGRH
jgi:hypothetical protein